MDEKYKSENMQKKQFSRFVIFLEQSGQAGVENGAMLTTYLFRYGPIQNAPFRSQIFKIFFASGGKRALTPLTKILRTLLSGTSCCCYMLANFANSLCPCLIGARCVVS